MDKKSIILYILLIILLVGCTKEKEEASLQQEDKATEPLEELNKSLDKILKKVGEVEKIDLDIDKPKETQDSSEKYEGNDEDEESKEEDSGESGDDGGGGDNGGNGEEDSGGESKKKEEDEPKNKEPSKPEKHKEAWKEIDKDLENVHVLWNVYESEGIKKGGSSEKANQFDTSINKMTKAIENRNIRDIYDYGSQGLLNLKPFFDLYKDDYRGDVVEIKHGIYQYYLEAIDGNKSAASKAINHKEENIQSIKSKIKEEEKEKLLQLDRVSYGLKNLVNSLKEDSHRLYIIKKDMVIKSIDDLENN